MNWQRFIGLGVVLIVLLGQSCVSHERLINFNEGDSLDKLSGSEIEIPELLVQVDDILQVDIKTWDMEAALPFNQNIERTSASQPTGYLVKNNGNINFPVIGDIAVAGLTTSAIRDTLRNKLKPYLKEPSVNVRLVNFKISVLGEVSQPGTIVMQDEQVSILEVLSMVGDVTPYANRENILIIREVDGKRLYGYLNLRATDVFKSPYFYLQQNDVVYVEPIKEKAATINTQASKIIPWVSVVVSMATLIISITK